MFAVRLLKNRISPLIIPEGVTVNHGDMVLVKTEKGEEVATVFYVHSKIASIIEKNKTPSLPLVRVMTDEDKAVYKEIEEAEAQGYKDCLRLIKQHNLVMSLIACKYTFDRKKVTFYYTAPERVDFRELLKDLTQVFRRVRIDLKHVGVRDETAICSGYGLCGKPFCCCSFKKAFEPINIKLARDQGMPITSGKISGTCGRLLCCLDYEYKTYIEAAKGMCPVGSSVMTPDGVGRVNALLVLSGKISVKHEDGKIKEYTKDEIEMIDTDVNIDIDNPYDYKEESEDSIDIKKLEENN